jgi:hypothetical protein
MADVKITERYSPMFGRRVTQILMPARKTASTPTTATTTRMITAPPPPNLIERVREAARATLNEMQSTVPTQRVLAEHEVRVIAATKGVPAPPDLGVLIRQRRHD